MVAANTIEQLISERLSAKPVSLQPVGGGSINDCYRINFEDKTLFCKANSATTFPQLLQKEKTGLELIARQNIIKTPPVVDCFEAGGVQVLLLEWMEPGERTEDFWKIFGEGLAALHQITNDRFGLEEDNYMGSVPQSNRRHKTWTHFFSE